MKKLVLTIYLVLFLTHQLLEHLNFHSVLLDSYLDDFLFLPLFLFATESIISALSKTKFSLTLQQRVFTSIYIMVIVECLFPAISNRFTFDYWDFLAYTIGFIVFEIGTKNHISTYQV